MVMLTLKLALHQNMLFQHYYQEPYEEEHIIGKSYANIQPPTDIVLHSIPPDEPHPGPSPCRKLGRMNSEEAFQTWLSDPVIKTSEFTQSASGLSSQLFPPPPQEAQFQLGPSVISTAQTTSTGSISSSNVHTINSEGSQSSTCIEPSISGTLVPMVTAPRFQEGDPRSSSRSLSTMNSEEALDFFLQQL